MHTNLSPAVLSWYAHHFSPCGFNGRFQLGFRKPGERGIWPLCMGDFEIIGDFLESMHLSSHLDYYITANSFSGVERKAESLFSLHNFVVDVDLHTTATDSIEELAVPPDFDTQEELFDHLIYRLNRDLFQSTDAPSPTSIIYTGRGIQLWWHIKPVSIKCRPWCREIHAVILSAIKAVMSEYPEFASLKIDGGASQNEAGYFRLPGTMNTAVNKPVTIVSSNPLSHDTHTLIKWAKQWKQENPPIQMKSAPTESFSGRYTDSDIYILKNLYTTGFFRVRQMIQLRLLRDNDVGEETRNNMCFIVYNALLPALGHDKAWDKLLAFNAGFKQPLTEKELHQTIDTARKKNGYRYKNETLITFLAITQKEQEAIGLYAPSGPFTPFARVAPNASRDASRKTIKENRNAKIRELDTQGCSRAQIARTLGIDRDTVAAVLGPSGSPSQYEDAVVMFEAGTANDVIANSLNVTPRTVQRYRKKWKENAGATPAGKLVYI